MRVKNHLFFKKKGSQLRRKKFLNKVVYEEKKILIKK